MDTQYRRILIPLDGSDIAQSAVAAAAGLSRLFDSKLTLITVLPENADTPQPVGALKGDAGASDLPASDVSSGGEFLRRPHSK